ncbi:hypothetical protein RRG08_015690 [Elysia crispata]|uniref:Uncharacterized protein n=1 Tax=Elysia crispata TaxID=231223 RepID=A0AAE0Y418_9GAST|nr:hypothetical protein RRG08_015690 [Elysia crispata]
MSIQSSTVQPTQIRPKFALPCVLLTNCEYRIGRFIDAIRDEQATFANYSPFLDLSVGVNGEGGGLLVSNHPSPEPGLQHELSSLSPVSTTNRGRDYTAKML